MKKEVLLKQSTSVDNVELTTHAKNSLPHVPVRRTFRGRKPSHLEIRRTPRTSVGVAITISAHLIDFGPFHPLFEPSSIKYPHPKRKFYCMNLQNRHQKLRILQLDNFFFCHFFTPNTRTKSGKFLCNLFIASIDMIYTSYLCDSIGHKTGNNKGSACS